MSPAGAGALLLLGSAWPAGPGDMGSLSISGVVEPAATLGVEAQPIGAETLVEAHLTTNYDGTDARAAYLASGTGRLVVVGVDGLPALHDASVAVVRLLPDAAVRLAEAR